MKKEVFIFRLIIFVFIILFSLFWVSFSSASSFSTEAIVTVNSIYELSLSTDITTEIIRAGESLSVLINLSKKDLTNIAEEIEVDMDYEIWKAREMVASGYAGFVIVKDKNETIIRIQTPANIKPGMYILKIKASHPQAYSNKDEDGFRIKKEKPSAPLFSIFFFLLGKI